MTLLLVMNLGFAWGPPAVPVFKPAWAANSNVYIGLTPPQPVNK